MRRYLQTLAVSTLLLAPACASADMTRIAFGIRIGEPPAPRVYRVPPRPGPEYVWVEGYWYPQGSRYLWHDGYWTRPPYEGAYWVAPYYVGGQYFVGQWQGSRNSFAHDHRWDRSRQRDERRDPRPYNNGNGNGNGRR